MTENKSFIEIQFPVSKISKESYKERKAGSGQTLTGLGKWWGRKPLILIRAAILGLLMPSSNNPKKDREIFLKILTMDDNGLQKRKKKTISLKIIHEYLTQNEKKKYFTDAEITKKVEYKPGISKDTKTELQELVFKRMPYDEKLSYCIRPEEVGNIDISEWNKINNHLGTNASDLQELIEQLGVRKFGRKPIIGDCFSGGGSIPFEAARMGCNVFASDLNSIAMLLTWASLTVLGSNEDEFNNLNLFQERVFNLADKIILDWGIEKNEAGHRANAYLYCNEVVCPECGYTVPLSPNWIIGTSSKTVALLKEDSPNKSFIIEIHSNASEEQYQNAIKSATIVDYNLVCPHCHKSTPIPSIRKDKDDGVIREYRYNTPNSLRKWNKHDFFNNDNDIFRERLYCIRYEYTETNSKGENKKVRYYTSPTDKDLYRESIVKDILEKRFNEWQNNGYIPDMKIEAGWNTNQLIYEKGWTYWHHLFNPRQLLINALLYDLVDHEAKTDKEKIIGILNINKCCDWNSKLSRWINDDSHTNTQTFYNQAFNTLFNYSTRAFIPMKEIWLTNLKKCLNVNSNINKSICDAREVDRNCDLWITDPPYADAVNYHELSEFFIAWDKKILRDIFPGICADSKRILAVKGTGESFNNSMIDIYKNLSEHMPESGLQIVMFTHQNVSVWAELTMILWAAGLRVIAAWNIATETDASGIKKGNYVKGTVLLVLRKQKSEKTAYLDELFPKIEEEVKYQIDNMRELDDKEDPNFSDADYLLASYAASLKVLTSYRKIEDIDIKYELSKERKLGEESPVEKIIDEAIKIAYDYLIPSGFNQFIWKSLIPEERFYIKGLDLEKEGVYQIGAYQELARGFGVKEYKELLQSTKANQARLKTALEFGIKGISDNDKFGTSVLRNVLVALYQSVKEEDTMKGKNWIKNELPNYWQQRNTVIEILNYISTLGNIENMSYWKQEAKYAKLLRELIKNDGV